MAENHNFEIHQLPSKQAMVYGDGADEQYRLLREISEPETLRINSFTFNPASLESAARSANPVIGFAVAQDAAMNSEPIAPDEHLISGDHAQEQYDTILGLVSSHNIRVTNFTINTEALLADADTRGPEALQTAQTILAKIPQIVASTSRKVELKSSPSNKEKDL